MARVILYPFQVEEVLHFRGFQENVQIFYFGIGTVLRQLALETFSCLLDKIVQQPFKSFHFKVFREHLYHAVACFWPTISCIWHNLAVLFGLIGRILG